MNAPAATLFGNILTSIDETRQHLELAGYLVADGGKENDGDPLPSVMKAISALRMVQNEARELFEMARRAEGGGT